MLFHRTEDQLVEAEFWKSYVHQSICLLIAQWSICTERKLFEKSNPFGSIRLSMNHAKVRRLTVHNYFCVYMHKDDNNDGADFICCAQFLSALRLEHLWPVGCDFFFRSISTRVIWWLGTLIFFTFMMNKFFVLGCTMYVGSHQWHHCIEASFNLMCCYQVLCMIMDMKHSLAMIYWALESVRVHYDQSTVNCCRSKSSDSFSLIGFQLYGKRRWVRWVERSCCMWHR